MLLLRVSCVLWGRNGQVNMDKRLRQEAFVFYLKKRFTLAKVKLF